MKIIKEELQFEESLNHRPELERLKNDIKSKKINTIVALKLDRITRSIYDWEN